VLALANNFASRIVTSAHLYPRIFLELATERVGHQFANLIAEGADVLIHAELVKLVRVEL